MQADTFLKCLQVHAYSFGHPLFMITDLGSNLTAGKKILDNVTSKDEIKEYLAENNIKNVCTETIPSKASFLLGFAENLVGQCKNLIFKSIGHKILELPDFQHLICKVSYLVNSRPIAFKNTLHSCPEGDVITPNLLIYGHNQIVLDIFPHIQGMDEEFDRDDPEYFPSQENINKSWINYINKLKDIKTKLNNIYYGEFLQNLFHQSTNKKDRYTLKSIKKLHVGDLVHICLPNTKRLKYPKGIITRVFLNSNKEVTSAEVRKANGELSTFHVNNLILALKGNTTM